MPQHLETRNCTLETHDSRLTITHSQLDTRHSKLTMIALKDIDLLSLQSGLKTSKDTKAVTMLFDPVRRKNIIVNPEEVVRQLWVLYFLEVLHINRKLIAIERSVKINGTKRRFDLMIFDKSTDPILLAEFKAPGAIINQAVFDQIGHYNMELNVPYSLVSNGSQHYCFMVDDEEKGFVFLKELPF